MKEELKFEILIMLCICFSAYLFEKLITISVISPLLLYGGVIGIALSLFVCALFTTMSVNTISDHPEVRRNTRILYGFLSCIYYGITYIISIWSWCNGILDYDMYIMVFYMHNKSSNVLEVVLKQIHLE